MALYDFLGQNASFLNKDKLIFNCFVVLLDLRVFGTLLAALVPPAWFVYLKQETNTPVRQPNDIDSI